MTETDKNIKSQNDYYQILLMEHSAGCLDEATSVLVSSHKALCKKTRQASALCDAVGGALLDSDCTPVKMSKTSLQDVLKKLDHNGLETHFEHHKTAEQTKPDLSYLGFQNIPVSLARFINEKKKGKAKWRFIYPGLSMIDLTQPHMDKSVMLLKAKPGAKAPKHTHTHDEITLILEGSFEDETGRYKAGDLVIMSETSAHRPQADPETGCICMIVTDGRTGFKAWFEHTIMSLFQ